MDCPHCGHYVGNGFNDARCSNCGADVKRAYEPEVPKNKIFASTSTPSEVQMLIDCEENVPHWMREDFQEF